jgi:hypothetical protein
MVRLLLWVDVAFWRMPALRTLTKMPSSRAGEFQKHSKNPLDCLNSSGSWPVWPGFAAFRVTVRQEQVFNRRPNEGKTMSDSDQNQGSQGDDEAREMTAQTAFPAWVMTIFQRPDEFFDKQYRGQKLFGLVTMGTLIVLIAMSSFVQRLAMTSSSGFRLSWLLNGIKFGLSFAIPIAALMFVLKWYSARQQSGFGLDFFLEKFGAAMALPSVLIAIAIPLNLLGITMHGWFRGSGLFFIYIAVFMMSYLYAAPAQIKPAVVFSLGFYFAYRLIWLLM